MGRKAASMVTSPGWSGYAGLGATSVSATILLAVGVVMSWSVGREFTDGTIVGLFAIPPALRTIAAAKMVVTLSWAVLLGAGGAALLMTAGLLLGLGTAGAAGCFADARRRYLAGHVGGDVVARLPGRHRADTGDPGRHQSGRRLRPRRLHPMVDPGCLDHEPC